MFCEGTVKSTGKKCLKKATYIYQDKRYCGIHCKHTDRKKIGTGGVDIKNQTITITLGDRGENNPGMEIIGNIAKTGFSTEDLENIKEIFDLNEHKTELMYLNKMFKYDETLPDASILIVRNFVENQESIFDELANLQWDKKMLSRGDVKNKKARWNLCFDRKHRDSDYENGKGTIIAFIEVPLFNKLRRRVAEYLSDYFTGFVAEGNYYYDNQNCGIGYHGDRERKITVGIRFGSSIPLCYYWYKSSERIGKKMTFMINGGDLYIMSDKAVGYDWMKSSIYTLRHAAGCDTYTS
jgi:hypothetical protein